MKQMMLLKDNQDIFDCPVCNKDKFHRYIQMFYQIHWCESCNNYFTIENKSGKRYVYQLNNSESKPIRISKPSKLTRKTKDLKYIIEKRNRQTQKKMHRMSKEKKKEKDE